MGCFVLREVAAPGCVQHGQRVFARVLMCDKFEKPHWLELLPAGPDSDAFDGAIPCVPPLEKKPVMECAFDPLFNVTPI